MKITVVHTAFEDTPQVVAEVEYDGDSVESGLEYAYRWTNNVSGSWSIKEEYFENGERNNDLNDAVTVMAPLHKDENGKEWGHRSTSVGDQLLLGNRKFKVASFGFEEIK